MKKTTISILFAFFVFVFSTVPVFAQGATATTTASTAAAFTSISPTVLVSDNKFAVTKTVTIRGRNLKGLATVSFVDKDGSDLSASISDNSSDTTLRVGLGLGPNENGVYTLKGTSLTIKVYDAESNTLRVNAAAGANAAKEVAALKKELEAQKTAASTTAEKIAAYEKQLADMAGKQTTVNSQATTQLADANVKIVTLERQIVELRARDTAMTADIAVVKNSVTSVDELVTTTADHLAKVANVDQMPKRERNPTKVAANRAVLEAIAKRNQARIAATQQAQKQ